VLPGGAARGAKQRELAAADAVEQAARALVDRLEAEPLGIESAGAVEILCATLLSWSVMGLQTAARRETHRVRRVMR
jgi:hypothetical protein